MGFISNFLGNIYARHLMNTPSFVAKLDAVNKRGVERVKEKERLMKEWNESWAKEPTVIWYTQVLEECGGNVEEANIIHQARVNLMREYDVTWEVACESLSSKTAILAKQLKDGLNDARKQYEKG